MLLSCCVSSHKCPRAFSGKCAQRPAARHSPASTLNGRRGEGGLCHLTDW